MQRRGLKKQFHPEARSAQRPILDSRLDSYPLRLCVKSYEPNCLAPGPDLARLRGWSLLDEIKRVSQLERALGIAAVQVALLVANVGDDRVALLRDFFALRGLEGFVRLVL
jgi:hypothetical protein